MNNNYSHQWIGNEHNQQGIAHFFSEKNPPIKLEAFRDFQYLTNLIDNCINEAYLKGQQSILTLVKNHINK